MLIKINKVEILLIYSLPFNKLPILLYYLICYYTVLLLHTNFYFYLFDQLQDKIVLNEVNAPEGEIPPSSLMSFLSKKRSLSGMVISEFESEYKNPYFESRLDSSDNINFDAICQVSTFLARSVFLLGVNSTNDSFGLNYDQVSVDCELVLIFISYYNIFNYFVN